MLEMIAVDKELVLLGRDKTVCHGHDCRRIEGFS